jgi:hypothetical protein
MLEFSRMASGETPEELKQFLLHHVEDLAELEILAWLHPDREGNAVPETALIEAMPFPTDTTTAALERLVLRGLVSRTAEKPNLVSYVPPDTEFRDLLRAAIEEYRKNPVQFMALMTAIALERVRTAALTTFAECFRLGGPKPHG